MQILISKNKERVQSFEPEWFAKIKIGNEWLDFGTGKTAVSSKTGANYIDLEVDDDILVDKLREIDWKAKGPKTAQFVKEVEEEKIKRQYPEYTAEEVDKKIDELVDPVVEEGKSEGDKLFDSI